MEIGQPLVALALVGEGIDPPVADPDLRFSFSGRRSSDPSCELIFKDEAARQRYLKGEDYEVVTDDWIHGERMRAGIPQVHYEVLPGDLPGEGGLVGSAVSLTKGCFLGQEVVARMHNVGRPQRGLYLVSGAGALPEVPVAASNEDGKALGELRTCILADSEVWKGVAMLKSRFVEDGMQLGIGEHTATVERVYIQGD
jgi:folate-binding protein YgfZ